MKPAPSEATERPFISRRRAGRLGYQRYFDPGEPCPRGHESERYVVSGACIECRYEAFAEQRAPVKKREKRKARLIFSAAVPCENGHTLRFVDNGSCAVCIPKPGRRVKRPSEVA
jgi:hypothetical protein